MLRKYLSTMLLLCMTILPCRMMAQSQDAGRAYLNREFPQLTKLYAKDLNNLHMTYIFAIDVSGTMNQYSETVVPSLKNFIASLPNGDYVRIIRFGTEARTNEAGYFGTIRNSIKADMQRNMDALYTANTDHDFIAHTDISKMMMAVADAVQKTDDQYVYVFILTDFRNDSQNGGEHKPTTEQYKQIKDRLEAGLLMKDGKKKYLRVISLQLPVDTSAPGYCLPDLRYNVLKDVGYESQMMNSSTTLREWFLDLRKNVWRDRLRTLVMAELDKFKMNHELHISIDGNVKCVTVMKNSDSRLLANGSDSIISTTWIAPLTQAGISKNGYFFKSKEFHAKGYKNIGLFFQKGEEGDSDFGTVDMGSVEHISWGLRYCTDTVVISDVVTGRYDEEMKRLEIPSQEYESHTPVDRLIFTFFLPFWVCCLIVALIILYLFLVYKAFARNHSSKYDFQGRVEVMEMVMRTKEKQMVMTPVKVLSVGNGGLQLNVRGAHWRFEVVKKTFIPFTLKKPIKVIRVVDGKVVNAAENWKMPVSDATGMRFEGSVVLKCGSEADKQPTHKVTVFAM